MPGNRDVGNVRVGFWGCGVLGFWGSGSGSGPGPGSGAVQVEFEVEVPN